MNIKHLFALFALLAIVLAACEPQLVEIPVTVVVGPTPIPDVKAADPGGDVLLPGVDILSSSATVFPDGPSMWVDLRLQFAATPFGAGQQQITWCLNTDQNAATGGDCNSDTPFGTDWRIVLKGSPNALITKDGFDPDPFACYRDSFDWTTNTLRMLIPLSQLSDDGNFNYAVLSASGDASASDMSPDVINFSSSGGYFKSQIIPRPLPFDNGVPLCGLQE